MSRVSRAQPRVRLALQLERRLQRSVGAAVEHGLQRTKRQGRPLGQLAGERIDRSVQRVVGHALGDQAPRLGALGRNALTRHHEELAARHPDQSNRALGAAAAGDHAETNLGKRELGAACGDPEVAGQRELEAGAHRVAVDGGDDGLAAPLGPAQRVAPQLEVGRRQREELGDVAASAERLATGAPDHDHPDRVITVEVHEQRGELVAHGHRHRVHLRLAVDPHRGDRALPLHSQELAHRAISVYLPSRSRRRRILPDAVFGISVTNTNRRGRLKLASRELSRQ